MGKTQPTSHRKALARFLQKINKSSNPKELQREAHELFPQILPDELEQAQKDLINNGYSEHLARHLSASFVLMGVCDENGTVDIRDRIPANHVLRLCIAEHEMMRCFLADLEDINTQIQNCQSLTDTNTLFRRLCHIIEHLDALREHFEREDDMIYPYLAKSGWKTLTQTSQGDHIYIKIAISDLVRLIASFEQKRLKDFKVRLNSISKYLIESMTDHLNQEECLLYPVAVEIIRDENIWRQIKELCDEVGYCPLHL